MDAVLAAERALGRDPHEMPHNIPGYDVRSLDEDGHLVWIEVKGRVVGAPDFVLTRTELLFAQQNGPQHRLALVEVADSSPPTTASATSPTDSPTSRRPASPRRR